MPYKNASTIQLRTETKRRLDYFRDYNETWEELLLDLLDYWKEGHKNNKKISSTAAGD